MMELEEVGTELKRDELLREKKASLFSTTQVYNNNYGRLMEEAKVG